MKKNVYQVLALVAILSFCIAMTTPRKNSIYNEVDAEWGAWSTISSNYPYIEARVKKGDYNSYAQAYHWEFQFRNRYNKGVHFNYGYSTSSERYDCLPDHAKSLETGESSDVTAALLKESYMVHICIGDVEFEE